MERHSIIKSTIILVASLLITLTSSFTFAGPGSPFNNIVFFGDSLSDDGNLFKILLKYLPKSPPYFDGRFSNGSVWAEMMADKYVDQYAISSSNYAYGGQTAIFHNPMDGYLPYTLSIAVDNYLLHSVFSDRSNSLYIIWIGANDYLKGAEDPEAMTSAVTNKIQDIVASLIYHGGKNFLIINLPDLGRTPYARHLDMVDAMHELAIKHNDKLKTAVEALQDLYKDMNIQLFDVNKLFTSVINDVGKYNKKYHMNIINTKDSCWRGGYTLDHQASEKAIAQDFAQHLRNEVKENPNAPNNHIDPDMIAKFIANSPALLEAYNAGKSVHGGDTGEDDGNTLCLNPEQYFFWDHVHPTHMVHTLFYKVMFDYIEKNYDHV